MTSSRWYVDIAVEQNRARASSRANSCPLRAISSETSAAMFRSVIPPELPMNILALIHASRARCVSRSNFFSANCRRVSA